MTEDTAVKNALSFDIEEYYHALNFREALLSPGREPPESRVEIGTERILAILEARSTRATFFFLGEVARERPALVRKIAAAGHEIASHGMSHRTALDLGPEGFREEAAESRKLLRELSGQEVTGFRASTFSITKRTLWALDILREEGYGYDSSIFPVVHDRYGIPYFPRHPVRVEMGGGGILMEIPLLTWSVLGLNLPCGGGGYFRLYPLSLTYRAIRRINAAAHPAVIYLHPWELDPDQPRQRLGGLKTFRHYVGLKGTAGRLEKLVKRFPFDTLASLAASPEHWPLYRFDASRSERD